MPSVEVLTWVLGGCFVVLSTLFGVVWSMLRAEAKEHARQIELKANNDRLTELDNRMERDMQDMAKNNERLIEKLEARQLRDIEIVSAGFREQVSGLKEAMAAMEKNILQQMSIMFHNQNKQ